MIHRYTDSHYDRTGTYRSVPGAGSHPSPAWLAARGWYEVADRPEPPAATGYVWQAADPAYSLVDGLSVPQGQWVARPLAEIRAEILAQFRAEAGAEISANMPAPWETLIDVASAEYREWAQSYREAVAAELSRLETAIAEAADLATLAAISAQWPEVAT
ncbi:MAG: hypothetical protein WC977_03925 [Anaerovoracaceae bacterium]